MKTYPESTLKQADGCYSYSVKWLEAKENVFAWSSEHAAAIYASTLGTATVVVTVNGYIEDKNALKFRVERAVETSTGVVHYMVYDL